MASTSHGPSIFGPSHRIITDAMPPNGHAMRDTFEGDIDTVHANVVITA